MIRRLMVLAVCFVILTANVGYSDSNVSFANGLNSTTSDENIVIDFEGSFEVVAWDSVTQIYDVEHGVWFFGSNLVGADSFAYLPRSGDKSLVATKELDGRKAILIALDPQMGNQGVLKVGMYYSGLNGAILSAYDEGQNLIGVEQVGVCCEGILHNELLQIEAQTPIVYLTLESWELPFSIDDFFYTRNQSACYISVPKYMQTDDEWKNNAYGSPTWSSISPLRTIEHEGCALTSSAMVLSYYGGLQNRSSVTPDELNDWLRAQNVGYVGGSVNWFKVQKYAQDEMGLNLWYRGMGRLDSTVLKSQVCDGEPMILDLNGHFVVATGSYESTWFINDPLDKSGILRSYYGNWYKSTRRFSVYKTDSRMAVELTKYIMISIDDDREFLVLDENGSVVSQSVAGVSEMLMPLDGIYQVKLSESAIGDDADVVLYFASEVDSVEDSAEVHFNGLQTVSFRYDSASSDLIQILQPSLMYLPVVFTE